jgi:hypothetical protein
MSNLNNNAALNEMVTLLGGGTSFQGLTDAQLRASALETTIAGNVSVAGVSTSANQNTSNTLLTDLSTNTINGLQKTQLVDSLGNSVDTLQSGGDSLMTAQSATNYLLSIGNSTSVQLGVGATFTGTIETILNQQALSIMINNTNRSGTLTIQQFIDNNATTLVSNLVFNIAASAEGFNVARTANGNFFRILFQNTSGLVTTDLNINTYQGTLPSVTNLGNAPISLDEMSGAALSVGQKADSSSIPVVISKNIQYVGSVNNIAIAALASDVFNIKGSATKKIIVTSLKVSGTQTTAGIVNVRVAKRALANTGGTTTATNVFPLDSINPAATATCTAYTANPTINSTLGSVNALKMFIPTLTTTAPINQTELLDKPVILNGVLENISIDFFGTNTLTGNNFSFIAIWEEV